MFSNIMVQVLVMKTLHTVDPLHIILCFTSSKRRHVVIFKLHLASIHQLQKNSQTFYTNIIWNVRLFERPVYLPRDLAPYIEVFRPHTNTCTRVYPEVSGLAAWSEDCKWYNSLPPSAVVSLF